MANYYNKDLYKILGVDFEASDEEIKQAYKKLVLKYHPDVAGISANEALFKDIQEAYEILKNKDTRKKYDILHGFFNEKLKRNAQQYTSSANKKNKYEEFIKQKKAEEANKPESFSKSINDALENLFYTKKQTYRKQPPKIPIDGENINIELTLSCFEAISGTNRKVNILHTQSCPNCEGRKFLNGAICPACGGTGQMSVQKKINVKIPKGITQGAKVRVKKEGNKGQNGGKDGDLFLIINIEKNKYFETEGYNLLCTLPVTPSEAVLGADVPIYIINQTINVKVPPMTSSGQKLRLTGMGLENKSKTKKGDMIITVMIKLPEFLSDNEIELYKKLNVLADTDIRKEMRDAAK